MFNRLGLIERGWELPCKFTYRGTRITKLYNEMKRMAKVSTEKPCSIIRSFTIKMGKYFQLHIPNNNNLTKQIRDIRKNKNKERFIFIRRAVRNVEWKTIRKNRKRMLHCIVLFTTFDNLKIIFIKKFWFMDGSFEVIPSFSRQLYTTHANMGQEGDREK